MAAVSYGFSFILNGAAQTWNSHFELTSERMAIDLVQEEADV
jgi:hypothetical protein